MLDEASQRKFAKGCVEATAGYMTAATAAYSQMASQVLDFWCTALSGLAPEAEASQTHSMPVTRSKPPSEPAFGLSMDDWSPFSWLDSRRYEPMLNFDMSTPPVMAMLAVGNMVPMRGSSVARPFAKAMIDSGVPRDVAWPAAEANAAALEAAEIATKRFRQVVASYHTENGFASAIRSLTPTVSALTATAAVMLVPLRASEWPTLMAN